MTAALKVARKVDVLVIGGGINGAGIARDLAGRGLSVVLCEKDDLASATSSASTKLIHGGLRYLEHYEFRLVREALGEREVLLRAAPHIIWPLTFVLPHQSKMRPRWMIRLGLFLYDCLAKRKTLPRSRGISMPGSLLGQPLKPEYKNGFTYADCWVEDTRLVILAALDAAEKGAQILTRTECVALQKQPENKGWRAVLQDVLTGEKGAIDADLVVNAAGPWVGKTLELLQDNPSRHHVRWVKGSHIIVPRIYQGDHAYILQNDDRRIVFVIPYERKFSLIGTTDLDYTGDLDEVRIDIEEVDYLCTAVNQYLRHQVKPEDVLWTYSGVRPLADDGKGSASEVTRDYILEMDKVDGLPILSVFGGKLTTFRRLAEEAGDKIRAQLGRGGPAWTQNAVLPGAEGNATFEAFFKTLKREFNWLPEALAYRYARAYGVRTREILRGMKRMADLGDHLGEQIYACEIDYLIAVEWAMTAEDVLWRRSKLGLHVSEETEKRVRRYIRGRFAQRIEREKQA